MTTCTVTGMACDCQPDEGVACTATPENVVKAMHGWRTACLKAEAKLRTQSQPAPPSQPNNSTWKLVPVEPTEQMIEAGRHVKRTRLLDSVKAVREGRDPEELMGKTAGAEYRAMLEAAPAPPVPSSVQEIMRLMMPYVRACTAFNVAEGEQIQPASEALHATYWPFEAALTALVDERDRLRFELDGVNAMRKPEWQPIETAPKDGTDILLYAGPQTFEGKPVAERNTSGYWLKEEGYIREHRDLDGRWIGQDESEGYEGWMSCDGGFTEENPPTHWMPRPSPPSSNDSNGDAS